MNDISFYISYVGINLFYKKHIWAFVDWFQWIYLIRWIIIRSKSGMVTSSIH